MRKFILPFLILYLYIFGVLLNHENAWMNPHVAKISNEILSRHTGTRERLKEIFNWELLEGKLEEEFVAQPLSRPRPLSHALQVLTILLRNWLFQYIPPHPSLSITWIFSLFLSPFFLYKLVRNLTGDKSTALLTSLIYLALPGNLIPIMMLFLPAKPLCNFFYIFCLYLGSEINNKVEAGNTARFKRDFLILVLTVALALFSDENTLFVWVLIPLFYPRLFCGRFPLFVYGLYLSLPLFYIFTIYSILPQAYSFLGFPGFNLSDWLNLRKGAPALNPFYVLVNFVLMLQDNLVAGFSAYLKDPHLSVRITQFFSVENKLMPEDNIRIGLILGNDPFISWPQIIHHVLVLLTGALLLKSLFDFRQKNARPYTGYLLKSLLALIAYTVFFSYLHITNNIISGCGWYGSGFSVFFAIAVGISLKMILDRMPPAYPLILLFTLSLIFSSLWNTRLLNYAWYALHYQVNYVQSDLWLNSFPRQAMYEIFYIPKKKNNFELTKQAWEARQDSAAAQLILKEADPAVWAYLSSELPYIK